VAISRIGNSSLEYDLAIFKAHQSLAAAQGQFTHVFVDRAQRKSTPIPLEMRQALQAFMQVAPEPKFV
jgi:acyl-CoA thioester hydrolase